MAESMAYTQLVSQTLIAALWTMQLRQIGPQPLPLGFDLIFKIPKK